MNEAEKNRFLPYITNSAKDEKSRENLKNIEVILYFLLLKIGIKKVEIFKKLLKNLKTMKTMNLLTH